MLKNAPRYEERIKAAKKAGIEAKKAALRAEDVAKGVFIPVGRLTKAEPQEGALSFFSSDKISN